MMQIALTLFEVPWDWAISFEELIWRVSIIIEVDAAETNVFSDCQMSRDHYNSWGNLSFSY